MGSNNTVNSLLAVDTEVNLIRAVKTDFGQELLHGVDDEFFIVYH